MKTPPFYTNPDNTHCWQACLRMILEHFEPEKSWTWEALDDFSAKPKDLGSYATTALYRLAEQNYDIQLYGKGFDYGSMGDDIIGYFSKKYSGDDLEWIKKNTIVPVEEKAASRLQNLIDTHKVSLTLENATRDIIFKLLNEGYLIVMWVNSPMLYGKEGFVGHFVVIYDIEDNRVIFHDPDYIGKKESYHQKSASCDVTLFLNAATNGGQNNSSIYAFNKKETS